MLRGAGDEKGSISSASEGSKWPTILGKVALAVPTLLDSHARVNLPLRHYK